MSASKNLLEKKYKTGVGDLSAATLWSQEGWGDEASTRPSLAQKSLVPFLTGNHPCADGDEEANARGC